MRAYIDAYMKLLYLSCLVRRVTQQHIGQYIPDKNYVNVYQ